MKKIVTLAWATLLILSLTLAACSAAPSQAAPTESPAVPTAPPPTEIPPPTPTPTPTVPVLGTYELLAPEDMRADLDELFSRLHNNHPDPYLWRPKAEVDIDRQRVYDELSQPLSMVEYYKKIAPLANSLGDDHTYVVLPDDVTQTITQSELFFPFAGGILGQDVYIVLNYSGFTEILPGTQLISINNIPISDVRNEIKHYQRKSFPRSVDPLMFWYIFGSIDEYTVEYLLPGQESPITNTIPGLDITTLLQNMQVPEETSAIPLLGPLTYTRLADEENIGRLIIYSFVGLGNSVRPAFAQIRQDGIQHLIIDIRVNMGGRADQINLVMNFLTDQPYRHCSKSWKAPAGGYGSTATWLETACKTHQPLEQPERYQGKLYLLVGQPTYSAGIILANILQDYDLAVLIGEETLSPASFCGDTQNINEFSSLPRTGLQYSSSHTCIVRPSGEADWQRGVIPDFIVETSIEDMLSGHDPVLEYTLELIRSGE
jgi:hypothetical protein